MAKTESVNTTNNDTAIIRVVDLSGNVMFSDTAIVKGANLSSGTLKAIGEASWVDIQYLGNDKMRLKNGSLELSFGRPTSMNVGGLDLGNNSAEVNINTRFIKLKSGKLFASIVKFEQLRKLGYYFSTDDVNLNLLHGSFFLESNNNLTTLSTCEGTISIVPAYAKEANHAQWPELSLSAGSSVAINSTENPKSTQLSSAEKALITKEFSAMGLSACSP